MDLKIYESILETSLKPGGVSLRTLQNACMPSEVVGYSPELRQATEVLVQLALLKKYMNGLYSTTKDGQRVLKKGDLTKYVKPIEQAKDMESSNPKAVAIPPAPVKPKVKQPAPPAPELAHEPAPAPIKEPEPKRPHEANNTTVHGSSLDPYVIPKLGDSQEVNGTASKSDTAEQPAPATETNELDAMSLDDLLALYSLGHEAGKIIQTRLNSYGLKLGGIANG